MLDVRLQVFPLFILLTVAFSCKQTGSNEPSQVDSSQVVDCIDRIMASDSSLGAKRNHECEEIPLSKVISNYTTSLSNLDFSNCDEAFILAFEAHIKAWETMIPTMVPYDDLRGEMHDLFDKIDVGKDSLIFRKQLAEVWSTWGSVEAVVQKYKPEQVKD